MRLPCMSLSCGVTCGGEPKRAAALLFDFCPQNKSLGLGPVFEGRVGTSLPRPGRGFPSTASVAHPEPARSGVHALPFGLGRVRGRHAPDEIEHERDGGGRVRLEQLVAGVEHMGFHPRQRLHP